MDARETGFRLRWLAPLGHLAVAAFVLLPAWGHGALRLPGAPEVDVWNHAWGPWWWWQSLSQGQLPWHTELLKAPVGGVLWFIDPLLAAVGAPLVPLLGPAGAFLLALLLSLALTSAATHALARTLGADRLSAWVAAAAVCTSAWVLCALHNGITEAVHLGPLAWALAETERTLRSPSPGRGLRLGLAAGLAGLASPYVGLGLVVAIGLRLLASGRHGLEPGLLLRALLPAALLGGLLAGAPTLLLLAQVSAEEAIVRRPGQLSEALALHNAVDPRTFVQPFRFRSVDLSAEGFEHSAYLGLLPLGMALVALVQRPGLRPWALAILGCVLMALGPWLFWDGAWVHLGDSRIPLPWRAFQQLLPGLALTHPLRLAMPAVVLVPALAACGLTRMPALLRWSALLVFPMEGMAMGGPWPIATAPAELPAVYDAIPADAPGAVLDLPTDVGATMATSRYLYWQTGHGRPVPWIPDARATTASLVAVPFFQLLAAQSSRRADEDAATSFERVPLDQADPGRLVEQGYRWVVLHPDLDPAAAQRLEPRLTWFLGEGQQVGGAWLWDLQATRPDHGQGEDAGEPPWLAEEERQRRRRAIRGEGG